MMSPNKNSEILSTGSETRLGFLAKLVGIPAVRSRFPAGDAFADGAVPIEHRSSPTPMARYVMHFSAVTIGTSTVKASEVPLGKSLGAEKKLGC
jgi:hypothetical protein